MFEVIPCIDIQRGRVVRLYGGDPTKETVYFEDPVEAARHWTQLGAARLHLVDLDAALENGDNQPSIERIARSVTADLEVGGGIRDEEIASAYLELVDRVVLGTAAIRRPELIDALLQEFGHERIVVSIDAREGKVATHGWAQVSRVTATDLAIRVLAQGVTRVIYTDVARDGTLKGVSAAPIAAMRRTFPHTLIAGGGVAGDEDVDLLERLGVDGAIVGRALYEGRITYPRTT